MAKTVSLADFRGKAVMLVMFICNHSALARETHSRRAGAAWARLCLRSGAAIVGISSNDVENYPQDRPEKMKEEAKAAGYNFPYLYDATQAIAKDYRAACTPDFYLFDKEHRLVYRGQFDDSLTEQRLAGDGKAICAGRWMRCWVANRFPELRNRASGAISNGKRGMSRIIFESGE